jgi:hypothetical protein
MLGLGLFLTNTLRAVEKRLRGYVRIAENGDFRKTESGDQRITEL